MGVDEVMFSIAAATAEKEIKCLEINLLIIQLLTVNSEWIGGNVCCVFAIESKESDTSCIIERFRVHQPMKCSYPLSGSHHYLS